MQKRKKRSWKGRLVEALAGFIGGLVLIVGAFTLIFWNESHGLHDAQALLETEQVLVSVSNAPIDPKNDSQPVYFSGLATTSEVLRDPILDVSQQAIKLVRTVEMYQWQEHAEQKPHESHYVYTPIWSDQLIKSSQFKEPALHKNPSKMAMQSRMVQAKTVKVGDFYLPDGFVDKMQGSTILDLSRLDLGPLQQKLNKHVQHAEYRIYVGKNPQAPEIGDLRITVTQILPQTVSVIAQQTGKTVRAYMTPIGHSVGLLAMGAQTPEQILCQAKIENKVRIWLLRLSTVLMMCLGVALLLRPAVVLAQEVPLFARLVRFGVGLLAMTSGLFLWTTATAIAWFSVRPVWSFGLMMIVLLFVYIIFSHRDQETY